MADASKVRTCLWFERDGAAAARFYVSLLPGSAVESAGAADPSKPPLIVDFTLAGAPFRILNGGPAYRLSPAASISVMTDDQAETDRLWAALTAEGEAGRCGWLKDRYGVSWQIVPRRLGELMSNSAQSGRVMQAMLQMGKIDIAALEAAADAV